MDQTKRPAGKVHSDSNNSLEQNRQNRQNKLMQSKGMGEFTNGDKKLSGPNQPST